MIRAGGHARRYKRRQETTGASEEALQQRFKQASDDPCPMNLTNGTLVEEETALSDLGHLDLRPKLCFP